MRGLNKVNLIGNLGQIPEIKNIGENMQVARFSLATNEQFRDKTGKLQVITEWHTVVMWQGLALNASKLLKKGSLVHIEGKIKSRSFEDKGGNKKQVFEIVADSFWCWINWRFNYERNRLCSN